MSDEAEIKEIVNTRQQITPFKWVYGPMVHFDSDYRPYVKRLRGLICFQLGIANVELAAHFDQSIVGYGLVN